MKIQSVIDTIITVTKRDNVGLIVATKCYCGKFAICKNFVDDCRIGYFPVGSVVEVILVHGSV